MNPRLLVNRTLNLQRQPTCRALVDGHWLDAHARFAKDEERDRLWTLLAKGNPWLGKAAARAGHDLAVIAPGTVEGPPT